LETGINLQGPSSFSAFANLALQHVTSRAGEDSGKQLKAIPRRVLAAGVSHAPTTGLSASVSVSNVGDTFLDDANTLTLPGHTQVDARLSYPLGRARLSVDARNLFGARFNSTGFPDPGGTPLVYYFPAARRVLTVGVESGW
jgi:outer membrane receptor protein involved in Fe transport